MSRDRNADLTLQTLQYKVCRVWLLFSDRHALAEGWKDADSHAATGGEDAVDVDAV